MNDTELDEMLDQWSVPPAPASLRAGVRAGFAASPSQTAPPGVPVRWRWAFAPGLRKALPAACMIGVGAFLWMVTQALSQTLPAVRIPYTVDSEFVRYGGDGSPSVEVYITSYNENGREIILSRSFPGQPLRTAFASTLDAVEFVVVKLALPFQNDADRERRSKAAAELVRDGCAHGMVVGHETILTYPATAVESRISNGGRLTVWRAPALGCFMLRAMSEAAGPNGTYRVEWVHRAIQVTQNPWGR